MNTELDPRITNFEEQLESESSYADCKVTHNVFYFLVPRIEVKFKQKSDIKKYMEEKGLANYQVIRGKCLETKSQTITRIEIV